MLPLLLLACSSGNNPPAVGGSGGAVTTGSGGASGSGGAPGSGGAMAGTGGAGGGSAGADGGSVDGGSVDGAGGAGGCAAPASPVIVDVSAVADQIIPPTLYAGVGIFTPIPAGTVAVASGQQHVQSMTTTPGRTAGTAASLAPVSRCVDATRYAGIKFKLKSPTNTSLLFTAITEKTQFRKPLTVGPTETEVMVAFSDLVALPTGPALPAGYQFAAHLIGIGLLATAPNTPVDIYIGSVTYY